MKKTWGNTFNRPAYLEIDLDALAFNVRNIKKKLGNTVELLAVVKGDGYGHGAYEVSAAALKSGASSLGVAFLEEGIELREKGIKAPILVLCPENFGRENFIVKYDLEPIVMEEKFVFNLSNEAARRDKTVNIYIKVDTGMKRFGLEPEQAFNFAEKISKLKNIRLRGILSHFSTSEEEDESFAKLQLQRFKEVVKKVEPFYDHNLIKSIANSGAVLKLPDSYFNQVRVGILLYGIYPSREVSPTIKIKPVMSLKSKIVTLKSVEKNTPVGYGRGFITKRKTTVGIIPLGYADGYSRLLSNRGEVLVKGKKAKIIGRVCMDAFMIDVTDVPRVKIGDEAVLVGKQGKEQISIDDISKWSEIFSYEVISRMGKRLPKVFVQNI